MFMLRNDIEQTYMEVHHVFPEFRRLNRARKIVILNMAFNLGVPRLSQFKRMWAAIREGDYEEAAVEMLDSRWARQVKGRAERLAKMMRTGDIPEEY